MSARDLITFGLGPAVSATPTAAQIADAVWDEARAGHVAAGSFGAVTEWAAATDTAAIADAVWDELSTGHVSAGKAGEQLWTDIDAVLEDTATTLPATLAAFATDDDVADAVWDEARAGHATDGTYGDTAEWAGAIDEPTIRSAVGLAAANLDTQLGALPTAAENADAVWDELSTGHVTAGKAGTQLWTDIDAIKVKTDTIGTGTATVAVPVAANLAVTTYQGDDYDTADGRHLSWTVSSTATLTGGTVEVIIPGVDTYTGSVVDGNTIRLELTTAQTAAIPVGRRKYQVIVTQTVALGADKITVVEGTWTSKARVTE